MDNTVGRLKSLLPTHQFDVIIGSLLGDSSLECRSSGIRHPITARFRVHHGEKQKEYVFWKYEMVKDLVSTKPKRVEWKNEIAWYFHTKTLRELGIIYPFFYENKIKIIPIDLLKKTINSRILAVWFMDDGSNTNKSFTLNTHCFSIQEQNEIQDLLKESFDISTTIIKDRSKYKIRIGRTEYEKFIEIVKPHIIPTMTYKI